MGARARVFHVSAWALFAALAATIVHSASASRVMPTEHSAFANGHSREGAFIGYTETAGSAGGSGDDTPKDSGIFESSRYTGERPSWCVDAQPQDCPSWAEGGECERNPGFMHSKCKSSCGTCVMKRKARERQGPRVYLDVKIGDDEAGGGRIVLDLFAKTHPRTSENFRQLCLGTPGWGYRGTTFHRIIPGFMNQWGSHPTSGSIYGPKFDDESFVHDHDEPFLLSMANGGPNTNGDQVFITVGPQPHLDGKHTVFGTVVEGEDVVMAINAVGTEAGAPLKRVVVVNSGELKD